MKANAWRKFLEEQRDRHGKVLFTVTELANVAGTSRAALNVELTRLRRPGDHRRSMPHGLYGLPGAVSPQVLVPAIDSHAYITGHYALYRTPPGDPDARHHHLLHGPAESPGAGASHAGRAPGLCVRAERVYFPVSEGAIAPPAQALCDYVYLSRRQGTAPESLVTFRNLARVRDADFPRILARYPISVQEHVERLSHPIASRSNSK